jgi:serine/threonine-protein kinase
MPPGLDRAAERMILERFALEGRLLYKLAHRGIARMFGVGATRAGADDRLVPFTVLEWLDGCTLAEHIEERARCAAMPLPLSEVVRLLDGAVDGLAYAHVFGVVHRDIKPRNLFVLATPSSAAYRTKLLDFGIAKLLDDRVLCAGPAPISEPGCTIMSPPYAAPEQVDPAVGPIGPWTDVYGLALATLEAATGHRILQIRHPREHAGRALDVVRRLVPSVVGLRWPGPVEQVLLKAVTIDPGQRWADAGIFWGALKHAISSAGVSSAAITLTSQQDCETVRLGLPNDALTTAE